MKLVHWLLTSGLLHWHGVQAPFYCRVPNVYYHRMQQQQRKTERKKIKKHHIALNIKAAQEIESNFSTSYKSVCQQYLHQYKAREY